VAVPNRPDPAGLLARVRSPILPGWILLLTSLLLAGSLRLPDRLDAQEISSADSAAVVRETARDFEEQGRADLAEALYQYLLDRFPGTPAAEEVRARFAEERGRTRIELERSGDVELRVWSTVYGGWLGIAIPQMAGADDPEPYGLGLLLGAPAGFLAARWYGSGRTITEGHARAVTLGGSWGTWQGLGWAQVFELGSDCFRTVEGQRICEDGPTLDATFGSMVAGGLLGIGTGAFLANRTDVSAGTSTLANFGALWGSGYGVAAGLLAGTEDEDTLWALALMGGNLGLLSGALLGPRLDLSRERARLISIAGVVGLLGGLGFDLLIQPESTEMGTLIPTLTSTGGLAVGVWATRGMDEASSRTGSAARQPGAGTDPTEGALARWTDGELELGIPTPWLTLRSPTSAHYRERGRDPTSRLAVGLGLFSARF